MTDILSPDQLLKGSLGRTAPKRRTVAPDQAGQEESDTGDNVLVGIRIRPMNRRERETNASEIIVSRGDRFVQQLDEFGKVVEEWPFDYVFRPGSTNEELYNTMAHHIVGDALEGYNGTVFAYGKTASGKTHTIFGEPDELGIIMLGIRQMFQEINAAPGINYRVTFSYVELYNEAFTDLLNTSNGNLKIAEDPAYGPYVKGLSEEVIHSIDDAMDLIRRGENNRHYGATKANDRSSRSHVLVQLLITQSNNTQRTQLGQGRGVVKESKLFFVDLAGSERQKDTQATGKRLQEATNINKSLMILGRVISTLSESGKKKERVPYRDSKLTHLLATSLGGNAKTALIATISPDRDNLESTLSTLQFATRAKSIQNHAQINQLINLEGDLENSWADIIALRAELEQLKIDRERRAQESALLQESMEREFDLSRDKVAEYKTCLAGVDQRAMLELGPLAQELKQLQREEMAIINQARKEEKLAIFQARKDIDNTQSKIKKIEKEINEAKEGATRKSKLMAQEIGNLQQKLRETKETSRTIAKRREENERGLSLWNLLVTPEVSELASDENIEKFLHAHPDSPSLNPPLPLGLYIDVDENAIRASLRAIPRLAEIEARLVPSKIDRMHFWLNFFSYVYSIKKKLLASRSTNSSSANSVAPKVQTNNVDESEDTQSISQSSAALQSSSDESDEDVNTRNPSNDKRKMFQQSQNLSIPQFRQFLSQRSIALMDDDNDDKIDDFTKKK